MSETKDYNILEITQSLYDLLLELNYNIKKNTPWSEDIEILFEFQLIDWQVSKNPNFFEIPPTEHDKLIVDVWLNTKGRELLWNSFGID